jgi:hypothetical protein
MLPHRSRLQSPIVGHRFGEAIDPHLLYPRPSVFHEFLEDLGRTFKLAEHAVARPSPLHVLGVGDDLAVSRIAAPTVVAEVIDLHAWGDQAPVCEFVGNFDGVVLLLIVSASNAESWIAFVVVTLEGPAFVRAELDDLLPETVFKADGFSSCHCVLLCVDTYYIGGYPGR